MTDYNQYNPYQPYSYQPPRNNFYAFVNGIEGAKSFPIGPNQTVLLMDSDSPMCFMKTSNNLGQSTLRYFKLIETTEQELKGPTYDVKSEIDSINQKIADLYSYVKKE